MAGPAGCHRLVFGLARRLGSRRRIGYTAAGSLDLGLRRAMGPRPCLCGRSGIFGHIVPDDGAGRPAKHARLRLAGRCIGRKRQQRRRQGESPDQHLAVPVVEPESELDSPDFVPAERHVKGKAEARLGHGAEIAALACCRVKALMKPALASEWTCPRGSSTWRSRNRPVSRKPSWRSCSVRSLAVSP